ncbi:ankyrin repeat domain-containing protein [Candidatus Dependentiae bacterium]|nr:ankyrin repeat domain-containing protein [Candidatus Dependentiae bacterium]
MKKLLFILLIPNLIFSMGPEPMEIVPTESNILEKFPQFEEFSPEIKLEILAQSFRGIVDPNKSAEENIKNLLDHREILMELSTEIKELVGNVGKVRILREIGNQLSKMLAKSVEEERFLTNQRDLVIAVSNFSNNKDMIKALTYVKDWSNDTLMHAAAFGDINAIKILKEAGADIDAIGYYKVTPLHYAAEHKIADAVKTLIELGANVNAKDHAERTPLYMAITSGNLEIVKNLIAAGSDINAENMFGTSPLDLAISRVNKDIQKYLIEHGAKSGEDLP